MARNRRAAAPATEVEKTETDETGGRQLRGPSSLHVAHAEYLVRVYGVKITAEQVYLAQATRKEFRQTEGSGYEEAREALDEAREEKAAEKEKRAEQKTKAEAETPAEATPAKRARRGAAAATEPAEAAEPAVPAARRGRSKASAPATETAEAAPTNGKAKRRAGF